MKHPILATLSIAAAIVLSATAAFAADPLDFGTAVCRIKIGSQATLIHADAPAKEIKLDGRAVRAGEIISNALKVEWLIAPSPAAVGDEYVFVIRQPKEKPKTYSAVFKGGYLLVTQQDNLVIEIEN